MIFVTTGTQLPFDRLVKAVDEWAGSNPEQEVFAQIGDGQYQPRHMRFVKRLDPNEYTFYFNKAQLVVSHVGMGTIISGLENAKPLVLMPRKAAMGEHRNDHQLGTAEKFGHHQLIEIVENEQDVAQRISESLELYQNQASSAVNLQASPELINRIRDFVNRA